jgi:phage major head subunit gpT-like protein
MIVRQQFTDLMLEDALPALKGLINKSFEKHPSQYPKHFRIMTSGRAIEQYTEITGLGLFKETPEGAAVHFDQPMQGFDKTFKHLQYSLGYRISRIMLDDDKWGLAAKMARELGSSARESREILAADVYNQAFNASFPGPDGKPLCATDHPLIKAGGNQTNRPTTGMDLDQTAIELALTDFRLMRDPTGKKVRVTPKRLVLPAQLEFVAAEFMASTQRADTGNNAVNALKHRAGFGAFEDFSVYEYLTDPDAWFILADLEETEMHWYDREKPVVLNDMDKRTRSIEQSMWYRCSVGFASFYGVYGSPGAD